MNKSEDEKKMSTFTLNWQYLPYANKQENAKSNSMALNFAVFAVNSNRHVIYDQMHTGK